MYGICCHARFNTYVIPYASRTIAHQSRNWYHQNQYELKQGGPEYIMCEETIYQSGMYCSVLMMTSEACLPFQILRQKNLHLLFKSQRDRALAELKIQVLSPLLVLPIFYLSRIQANGVAGLLLKSQSTLSFPQPLYVDLVNLNRLFTSAHRLKAKAADSPPDDGKDKDVKDKLAKNVKWMKKNVTDDKSKIGALGKKGSSMFGRFKSTAAPEKKAVKSQGDSWKNLEAKLPVWQGTIAEILQKFQDLIFRSK